jgi:serine phosphatase RsbU (regulator of sigma subunit)
MPLGVDIDTAFAEARTTLGPGDVVVLYTDGLIERRGYSIDARLEELRRAVEAARDAPPEELADEILRRLVGDSDLQDDIALLVLASHR